MRVLTTSIEELTERLLRQSERQALLLAALREYRTSPSQGIAKPLRETQDPASDLESSEVVRLTDSVDEIDELEALWQLAQACKPLAAIEVQPITICEEIEPSQFDHEADRLPDSVGADLTGLETTAEPIDAIAIPVTLEVSEAFREREPESSDVALSEAPRSNPVAREAVAAPGVARVPVKSAEQAPSSVTPRKRRNYNYFADLEARLSVLEAEGGATTPT